MSLVLNSSGGGSVTIDEPATASNFTQTLAAASGTLAPIVSGTAVTASGTSVDFTGIPAYAKRITVMFSGVSTNGTSNPQVQIGSGSVQTSGYVGSGGNQSTTVASSAYTSGIGINSNGATNVLHGTATLTNISGNTWVGVIVGAFTGGSLFYSGGTVTLSGILDSVRITTVNGTDTFDAGTINIMWE